MFLVAVADDSTNQKSQEEEHLQRLVRQKVKMRFRMKICPVSPNTQAVRYSPRFLVL